MNNKLKNLQNKSNHIREATEKASIARVFFLILDGVDYTKSIAEAYYSSGSNKKMNKKLPNSKVIAIYLSTLKEAGLIKKKEKDGRIQRYEIDWLGLFDLISLGNAGEFSEAYHYSFETLIDFPKINQTNQYFIDNFVKPYFEKRKEELKLAYGYLNKDKDCKYYYSLKEANMLQEKHGKDFCFIPLNFDNVDFNLDNEIKIISSVIVAPYYYNYELVARFLKNKKNKENPIYPIFNFIRWFNERNSEYTSNEVESKKFLSEKIISILNGEN
jgi:hypothetical protein